ncbi:Fic family protein [Sphingobacterium olei]|uniref:Fic family protein n=1 Tax=Sphingobacterium olei TaxID=2571155 RepID=A0A4U0PB60_9SPHI|nr:Fic family protein [Sphingobacterium olei]TJZ59894.1 Fic family protein [Sphingobacterium olei]
MNYVEKAELLKKDLNASRPLPADIADVLRQKFRFEWNYHSNSIEGNSLSFTETKALLLHGITAQGKPLKDHFEITGHDEAIKWVEDLVKGDHPLTENFIRELHTLLLRSPYEVKAVTPEGQPTTRKIAVGQYKTSPNHVKTKTGEIFRFATPEETPAKMHDLIIWYREKSEEVDINPIILAAEFHYRFIRIHPFDDGNGRTARILMNFILMKYEYPPIIIKTEDKENYFSALRQADAGTIDPFINYIAKNLIHSLEIMIAGAKGESIEDGDDALKELILLKAKLKNGKSTKSPILAYDCLSYFMEEVKPRFEDTISKVDDLFSETQKSIYVNGETYRPSLETAINSNIAILGKEIGSKLQVINSGEKNLTILGKNLYKDDVQEVTFREEKFGLKGANKKIPFVIDIKIILEHTHLKMALHVSGQKNIEKIFGYDDRLDEAFIISLENELLKNMTNSIKHAIA